MKIKNLIISTMYIAAQYEKRFAPDKINICFTLYTFSFNGSSMIYAEKERKEIPRRATENPPIVSTISLLSLTHTIGYLVSSLLIVIFMLNAFSKMLDISTFIDAK